MLYGQRAWIVSAQQREILSWNKSDYFSLITPACDVLIGICSALDKHQQRQGCAAPGRPADRLQNSPAPDAPPLLPSTVDAAQDTLIALFLMGG